MLADIRRQRGRKCGLRSENTEKRGVRLARARATNGRGYAGLKQNLSAARFHGRVARKLVNGPL
jgi:hypothetical protein